MSGVSERVSVPHAEIAGGNLRTTGPLPLAVHLGRHMRYLLTTAQLISRLAHRGSVEVERVLRRLNLTRFWRIEEEKFMTESKYSSLRIDSSIATKNRLWRYKRCCQSPLQFEPWIDDKEHLMKQK
jgi:hypothetical protein